MLPGLTFPFKIRRMNKETVLAEWQEITDRLSEMILSFNPAVFNQKRSENNWSAAQIAEHLLRVDLSTFRALKAETVPTNRPPDQKNALIKDAMQSDTKRVAPDMVMPSGKHHEPKAIAQRIKDQREGIKNMISDLDLTEACKVYKHPALGTLTRLEWVYFNIYHADRHMRQMQQLQTKASKEQQ